MPGDRPAGGKPPDRPLAFLAFLIVKIDHGLEKSEGRPRRLRSGIGREREHEE